MHFNRLIKMALVYRSWKALAQNATISRGVSNSLRLYSQKQREPSEPSEPIVNVDVNDKTGTIQLTSEDLQKYEYCK